jgi:lipopolysaccharide heptosyltransferase II
MRDLSHREFQRILIIKPSSFGDVIHALPILHGLRARYPDSHISWMVSTACMGLLEDHPELDEIIPFDRKHYGKLGRSWPATRDFVRFVDGLRRRQFDLVVDLQGLFRSGFLARASGAATRIGFRSSREFGWIFYTHRLPDPALHGHPIHAVDRNYLAGRVLGFGEVPVTFKLGIPHWATEAAREKLQQRGLAKNESYVLVGPGSRWETKVWPPRRYAEVADYVATQCGMKVVLVGSPDERRLGDEIEQAARSDVINFVGETSIAELAALTADATAVVMNDSGPMHLAPALGRPLVTVFGPTSADWTGPYRQPDSVVQMKVPCSPCRIRRVADCPHDHRCMGEITSEMVCRKLDQILREMRKAS